MATTTNYGWTTPDDTALVKDGAAAIRTLGSSVDTTTKALNPSTTLGDIEYRSSTANTNTRLAIGTTGQVLTVAGGVPSWASPAGGGKVLQVIQGTGATSRTSSSTTFADAGLSATITPSSASSKILVIATHNGCGRINGNGDESLRTQLLRGATVIQFGHNIGYLGGSSTLYNIAGTATLMFLDSPATTSATTYKTEYSAASGGSGGVIMNANDAPGSIILMEIGA